jgi:hypothetical protein
VWQPAAVASLPVPAEQQQAPGQLLLVPAQLQLAPAALCAALHVQRLALAPSHPVLLACALLRPGVLRVLQLGSVSLQATATSAALINGLLLAIQRLPRSRRKRH